MMTEETKLELARQEVIELTRQICNLEQMKKQMPSKVDLLEEKIQTRSNRIEEILDSTLYHDYKILEMPLKEGE